MADKDKKMKTTLRIVGEINIETLKTFLDETDEIMEEYERFKAEASMIKPELLQKFPPITVEISSYGGCTDCGSAIIHRMDEMKNMGIEVNTHCHFAYSMAFIIFVNGMKRTGDKLSKFMNHGSASLNRGYVEEQRASVEFSTKCDEQFEQIIYDNTNMSKERVEKARLCYDWILYDEAVELGIINYYEGCEKQVEEEMDRVSDALESALEVFSQLLGMEKEDGFDLMLDLLAPIYEEVEEVKDKEEVETTEDKEDKNELSEVLGEILDKAMDEDEVKINYSKKDTDEVPAHTFDIIRLEDEVMGEVMKELKDITNADYDGCYCGSWSIYIDDLGYLTLDSSCRKSGNCPDGKEYHIDEEVYILDRDVRMDDDAEILFEIEHDQALKIVNMAYLTLYADCGMDEFGNYLKRKGE